MKNLSTSVLISAASKSQLLSNVSSKTGTIKANKGDSHSNLNRRVNSDDNNSNDTIISMQTAPLKKGSTTTIIPLRGGDTMSDESSTDTKKKKLNDHTKVSLFGIDLSRFPVQCQGALLISIILAGFLSIGYVEEGFKFEFHHFSYGWFMTAIELIIFAGFAMTERLFKSLGKITSAVYLSSASTINLNMPRQDQLESETKSLIANEDGINNKSKKQKTNNNHGHGHHDVSKSNASSSASNSSKICLLFKINWFEVIFERQMPLKYHLMVAMAMMCSRALTNIALLLLNYPTQVIFKSMKLISVMFGSVFCLKKQYHKCEWIGAPILVISAVLFTMGDSKDLNFNVLGIVVVVISLIFDAIHANSQQYILQAKTERDTTMELLVYTNIFAGVMALIVSLFAGELNEIYYEYLPEQPPNTVSKLFMWFLIRVACLYIGVSAFVVFTKRFGAVFAVCVTTIRKIMTVLLSYVFYPGKKAFIPVQHGTGTLLFILSLILWGYGTIQKKKQTSTRPNNRR